MRSLILALLAAACTPPPDVIILTVDTLRADHVSATNPDSPVQTPGIDRLAADGVNYTRAYSPVSVTAPAFASVMTGVDPGVHGVLINVFRGGATLAEEHVTVAERLKAKEYTTGGFVSAYTLRREVGLAQGFDTYDGGRRANRWGNRTTALTLSWLEPQKGPLMLWYHSYDPHGPVKRFAKAQDRAQQWVPDPAVVHHFPEYQLDGTITDPAYYKMLYRRGVTLGDRQVGRIVDALQASGRYERAMIVVLSDHGETFTERPLWFDHGTSAHEEQLHVPLIIKYPDGEGGGTRDDRLVSLMDVAPTIMDVLGLDPLERASGVSLRTPGVVHEVIHGESSHCKRVEVLPCAPHGGTGKELAVRSITTTLIRQSRGDHATVLSYDRLTDPQELTPTRTLSLLRDGSPNDLEPASMGALLESMRLNRYSRAYAPLPELGAGKGGKGKRAKHLPAVDVVELQKLRSLGYIE